MISDDIKTKIFGDVEDKLNETGAWLKPVQDSGGDLDFVQLDIADNGEGYWSLVGRVIVSNFPIELSQD